MAGTTPYSCADPTHSQYSRIHQCLCGLQEALVTALEVSASLRVSRTPSYPQSADQVVLEGTQALLQPSVCGSNSRGFANALWQDVAGMLQQGRAVVLVALGDLHSLAAAAEDAYGSHRGADRGRSALQNGPSQTVADLPASSSAAASPVSSSQNDQLREARQRTRQSGSGPEGKRAARAAVGAKRKAWFLLVWANELRPELFESMQVALRKWLEDLEAATASGQQSNFADIGQQSSQPAVNLRPGPQIAEL